MSRSYGTRFRPGATNSSWRHVARFAKTRLRRGRAHSCTHGWRVTAQQPALSQVASKCVTVTNDTAGDFSAMASCLPQWLFLRMHGNNGGMSYAESCTVCARQRMSTGCKLLAGQLCCCCLPAACLHRSTSSTFYLYETRCDRERSKPQPYYGPHSQACPRTAPHRLPRTIC